MRYDLTGISPAMYLQRQSFERFIDAIDVAMQWIGEGWTEVHIGGDEGLPASEDQIRALHRLMAWADQGVGPVPAIWSSREAAAA